MRKITTKVCERAAAAVFTWESYPSCSVLRSRGGGGMSRVSFGPRSCRGDGTTTTLSPFFAHRYHDVSDARRRRYRRVSRVRYTGRRQCRQRRRDRTLPRARHETDGQRRRTAFGGGVVRRRGGCRGWRVETRSRLTLGRGATARKTAGGTTWLEKATRPGRWNHRRWRLLRWWKGEGKRRGDDVSGLSTTRSGRRRATVRRADGLLGRLRTLRREETTRLRPARENRTRFVRTFGRRVRFEKPRRKKFMGKSSARTHARTQTANT